MTQLIDLGKLRFHFAGEWSSATQYEANDIVKYGGNVYVYTYGLKTSANLPTDNAYWALMVEGFKFSGVFDSSVEYQVGDGVTHGGKVYVAQLDTQGNTPPNATYWSQFVDGIQWEGAYDNTAAYQKNDLVSYGGGSLYIAKVDTTGNLPSDTTYWQKFLEGISVQSIYNASTVYTENDLVAYGGNVYRAKGDTTGNAPSSPTHWEIFVSGVSNRGAYDAVVAYALNDIVAYGGNLYRAKVDTIGNAPSSTTHWEVFSTGFNPLGAYDAATAYALNDVVGYGGGLYRAIADTTGNAPTATNYWQLFQDGMNARGVWSTATAYYPGDVVSYGGNTFRSLTAHASANFDTDLANGQWVKFNGGVAWRGAWSAGVDYLTDDIVRDSVGTVYIANLTHTSGIDFASDKDVSGAWTLFVAGGADVLPAIVSGDSTKQLSISGDGATLEWTSDSSANVYYVASHGQDLVGYGRSIAYPFASIRYACSQVVGNTKSTIYVKNGTYDEQLPIIVPANVAIIGDSQRTTIVQPASGDSDGGIIPNNEATMWLLSDGSLLNKMTFKGMTGWLPGTPAEDITVSTERGVFCALNPSSAVATKSPYVIECSAIGSGAIGAVVDGSVHSTGNKSMLFHGYTVIADNGVGFWIKEAGKAEIVSCFTYYCYFGYATTGGGFIRALNGNNSYGTWGAVSSGFDSNELYISGTILGRELNFTLASGNPVEGETVTDNVTGGTATVTNIQLSANKIYVKDITGTFGVTNGLTFGTSGANGSVSGGGLEDQSGFILMMDGFDGAPKPGMSLSISGDPISYVIQSVSGTYIDATSELIIVLAQEKVAGSADNAAVHLRKAYSQIRLTGHDFLNIGTGGIATTNYPGVPIQPPAQGNETNEAFPGRVYYVSTDQDGNFRVGEYFRIDQATGRATLNASAFDLAGLTSLRLGSIGAQLGETINEFSADATLSGASNSAVPTEYAVKTYVDTTASGAQSAAETAANAYTDLQLGSVSSTDIPFIASISADGSVPSNSMRFSMDTVTVNSGVTYTIPTGSYHFVLNPNGFALFQ